MRRARLFLLSSLLLSCGSDGATTGTTPSDAGTDTQTTGDSVSPPGKPPVVGGCQIFPEDNPWNRDVSGDPVDPDSDKYIAKMSPATKVHPDWGGEGGSGPDWYGIPWMVVPATEPMAPMTFDAYGDESDPSPYPIPANAPVEGPPGATDGDRHVLVIQSGTCLLYELGVGRKDASGAGWTAACGAKFDLKSNALRPERWTSADAAGLPIFPGLVRFDAVAAGRVKPAVRLTMDVSQKAYIHPATHWASSNTDPYRPPMGLRVRLKASFDASTLKSAQAKVIVAGLKKYGMLMADNGSDWYITGDRNNAWKPLMEDLNTDLGKIKGSDFEVVKIDKIYKP